MHQHRILLQYGFSARGPSFGRLLLLPVVHSNPQLLLYLFADLDTIFAAEDVIGTALVRDFLFFAFLPCKLFDFVDGFAVFYDYAVYTFAA